MKLALLLPALLACSQPEDCIVIGGEGMPVPDHLAATLAVDEAFSEPERETIAAAAIEWEAATSGRGSLTLEPGDASGQWAVDSLPYIPRCRWCAGLTDLNEHRIELASTQISGLPMLYATALHEFGHFLGLGHSTDPDQLMFGCYVGNEDITAADVAAFDALYPVAL